MSNILKMQDHCHNIDVEITTNSPGDFACDHLRFARNNYMYILNLKKICIFTLYLTRECPSELRIYIIYSERDV